MYKSQASSRSSAPGEQHHHDLGHGPDGGAGAHGVAVPEPRPSTVTERRVHSLQEALQTDEGLRWISEGHDLEYPAVPFPSRRVMRVAGEPLVRAVVMRHHDLLRRTAAVGPLFPKDDATFRRITARVADFVVEACGGAPAYTTAHGHTCMRTRHLPFTIDEGAREVWLGALWRALEELAFPWVVREEYWNWLEAMSVRMINRRTTKAPPRRFPYACMLAAGEKPVRRAPT